MFRKDLRVKMSLRNLRNLNLPLTLYSENLQLEISFKISYIRIYFLNLLIFEISHQTVLLHFWGTKNCKYKHLINISYSHYLCSCLLENIAQRCRVQAEVQIPALLTAGNMASVLSLLISVIKTIISTGLLQGLNNTGKVFSEQTTTV